MVDQCKCLRPEIKFSDNIRVPMTHANESQWRPYYFQRAVQLEISDFWMTENSSSNEIFSLADQLDRVKRIWYLSPMRAAKVQASLRIRAVSPEPSLLAHISSESRGTFRQKARSLAPLNGWACAVKICHDGMLEDTNSLGGAQLLSITKYQLNVVDQSIVGWTITF